MSDVKMTVAARSDVGRARTNNEDAFTIVDLASGARLEVEPGTGPIDVRDRGALLALSDGMGGHQAGEVASALVLESLRSAMTAPLDGSIESKLEAAVSRANADVARVARTQGKRGMGATLTAVFVAGEEAYVAEVGDSRAYLLRAGELVQVTRDQSLVQMLVNSGALSPEEAKRSPQKNVILQAMGLADHVRVAIGRLRLRRRDTILICSDGISNAIPDSELGQILITNEPTSACARLIDLANERGGEDNLTAIVACFDGEDLAAAAPTDAVGAAFEVLQDYSTAPAKPDAVAKSVPPSRARESGILPTTPAPPHVGGRRARRIVVAIVAATAVFLGAYLLARSGH